MKALEIPIIPSKVTFTGEQKTYNLKAICVFSALGFFLDDDTYFLEQKALRPATKYQFENGKIISETPYFKWHYTPLERPLQQIVEEFADLFEQIIDEQIGSRKVILPLSGGLDSRTQAVALRQLGKEVHSYSYSFQNGLDESGHGKQIAKTCDFSFTELTISNGYLWGKIEDLAQINGCYSEFTHPRQMAVIEKLATMGEIFSLGHWGDVLFDDMGVPDDLPFENQVDVIIKKIVKKGGVELSESLWKSWGLEGNFIDYLKQRVAILLKGINIPQSANAQIRAFKSLYWAPRWTSSNLSVFESVKPMTLPYYDNRMCEFICTVPEKYLTHRQIQIEYIKLRNPKVAKIAWQQHRPFNLYSYHLNKVPYNLPYRIYNKLKRTIQTQKFIQRNWELQFLGNENEMYLKRYLFDNEKMSEMISKDVVSEFHQKFKNSDQVYFSHPVSMLLSMSLFFKNNKL